MAILAMPECARLLHGQDARGTYHNGSRPVPNRSEPAPMVLIGNRPYDGLDLSINWGFKEIGA
jgi:hypothetical protein